MFKTQALLNLVNGIAVKRKWRHSELAEQAWNPTLEHLKIEVCKYIKMDPTTPAGSLDDEIRHHPPKSSFLELGI